MQTVSTALIKRSHLLVQQVPRRHPASAANSATALDLAAADAAAAAGDSDGDEFPPGAEHGGHGGWAIAGVPPHLMAGGGDATMSLPYGPASPLCGEFRPVSFRPGPAVVSDSPTFSSSQHTQHTQDHNSKCCQP